MILKEKLVEKSCRVPVQVSGFKVSSETNKVVSGVMLMRHLWSLLKIVSVYFPFSSTSSTKKFQLY